MHVKTIIHQRFPLQHWHVLHPDRLISVFALLVSKQCTKTQTKRRPSAHRLILAASVRIRVPAVLDGESRDGCSGAAIHEPFLPCHNNKGEQIKSRSYQSAERKVGRTKPATHEFIKPFITGCFGCQKSWTQFFFSFFLNACLCFPSSPVLLLLLLILLLHFRSPPTPSLLWSIRLSVHSQKWLWHLLKRPAECSGLKGYPMLWPKTARFLFFSLSLPSKSPLWHCALLCRLPDHSLNIFKLTPMKDFLPLSTLPHTHTHTSGHDADHAHTCRCAHAAH